MYLPLVWLNSAGNISFGTHSLASAISVNSADTRFTITLNPKWHWSNGTPVTAQDVQYYYQLMQGSVQGTQPITYCYAGSGGFPKDWGSVTTQGTHTLIVATTTSVNPAWFERNGLGQLVAIPKATWDKYSSMSKELSWIKSIGNEPLNPVYKVVDGPYYPVSLVANDYWRFAANPHYDGSRPPAYAHVNYVYEASATSEMAAMEKGQIQMTFFLPMSMLKAAQSLKGYGVVNEPSYGFYYIAVNFHSNAAGVGNLFSKLYIRQALQLGINQPGIISALYHGYAVPTYGPVPVAPHNAFFDYGQTNSYPYDPARGKALLEAHGWTMVNGVMTKNGQQLAFPYWYTAGTSSTNEAVLLQQGWAQEGIKVTPEPEPIGTLYATISNPAQSNKWALAGGTVFGWLYIPDFYPSGGSLFATGAGFNLGGYSDPTMDSLIASTYQGGTPQQVTSRFTAYQLYAAQQLPVLYQPTGASLWPVSNQVKGFRSGFDTIEQYVPWNWLKP